MLSCQLVLYFPVVLCCANFTNWQINKATESSLSHQSTPLSKPLDNFLVNLTVKLRRCEIASLSSTDLSTKSGKLGREGVQWRNIIQLLDSEITLSPEQVCTCLCKLRNSFIYQLLHFPDELVISSLTHFTPLNSLFDLSQLSLTNGFPCYWLCCTQQGWIH